MAKQKNNTEKKDSQKPIEQYEHKDKQRLNNPPVGLVDAHTDNGGLKKQKYEYDPHLDPQLQWAGKAEHTSFEVPTVSLHVHERIDPRRIIEQIKKEPEPETQLSLFQSNTETKGLSKALEFYKHKENWSNRLIAGDSLLVMNSLLQKESMGGKVQMVFFDPPYGITYKSNFQPFVNNRDVKEKDGDLTAEPEMIKAFRDTWELGIHSYLTYLRDRLLLAKDLLHESGSVFVQISDENVHHVRELMDEVFGNENFIALIPFRKKTMPFGAKLLERMNDFLILYSNKREKFESKYHSLFIKQSVEGLPNWTWLELKNGEVRKLSDEEHLNHKLLPEGSKVFRAVLPRPSGYSENMDYPVSFNGKTYNPPKNGCWSTPKEGMQNLIKAKRIFAAGDNIYYKLYHEDYPVTALT